MLSCGEKRKYSPQNIRRIIALPVIQNKIRRFNRRRQSDELELQAQYVFVYFYVLCHHHFINFTLQRYTSSFNYPFVQLLDGEYQVPVATPDDVAAVKGEGAELFGVKVFVVLRMRVPTDVVADIHRAVGAVAENQPHLQTAKVNCFRYV